MALLSARKIGLLVAATGAAHFAAPDFFETVAGTAFPENTREWVHRNGATELALGAALTIPKTRKLGILGLLAYLGFLGSRVVANR